MLTPLSANFTVEEFTFSQTARRLGLDNTPGPAVLASLRITARKLEAVRTILGNRPITVTSAYRSPAVNKAVGGAPNSAHQLGYAVDFTCKEYGTPFEVAQYLYGYRDELRFDQLIFEFGDWVHISFAPNERREALTIFTAAQGYLPGIVEEAA